MRTLSMVAWVTVLAACEERAIQIVVHPPVDPAASPVDEVRLYVATGHAETSTAGVDLLVPGGFTRLTAPREATYWSRDQGNEADRVTLASPTDAARFVFTPGDSDQLSAVIAVGFTNGAPTSSVALYDAHMPADHVALYEVGLHPIGPLNTTNTGELLHLWGPEPGDQTCVMARSSREDGDPDYRGKTVYIVTDGDPDCDGYVTGGDRECRELVYRGQGGVPLEKVSCISSASIASPLGSFDAPVLGGPTCKDGEPAAQSDCAPGDYCLPASVDAACDSLDCASSAPLEGTYIECQFNILAEAVAPQLCPARPRLSPIWTGGQMCTGEYLVRQPMESWRDRLESPFAKVTFAPPTADCTFELAAELINPEDRDQPPITGLVAVNVVGGRGIAIPLRVAFDVVQDCELSIPPFCKVVNDVSINDRRCVGTPIE